MLIERVLMDVVYLWMALTILVLSVTVNEEGLIERIPARCVTQQIPSQMPEAKTAINSVRNLNSNSYHVPRVVFLIKSLTLYV